MLPTNCEQLRARLEANSHIAIGITAYEACRKRWVCALFGPSALRGLSKTQQTPSNFPSEIKSNTLVGFMDLRRLIHCSNQSQHNNNPLSTTAIKDMKYEIGPRPGYSGAVLSEEREKRRSVGQKETAWESVAFFLSIRAGLPAIVIASTRRRSNPAAGVFLVLGVSYLAWSVRTVLLRVHSTEILRP
jgi:hypothetical protein